VRGRLVCPAAPERLAFGDDAPARGRHARRLAAARLIRRGGDDRAQTGLSGSLLSFDAGFATGTGTFRNNEVSSAGVGIRLEYWTGLALTNNVHDNGTGVIIDDNARAEVRSNLIRHDVGSGLLAPTIGSHGLGRGGLITSNQVRDNGQDGIAIFGCSFRCFPAYSEFRLERNTALGNGRWDCFDDGSGTNVWNANVGVKDSPNVCAKP